MSKVSIAGDVNGTGVFTIAAPNGNTNRTITLPDVTATVITDSAGVLNIGAGQLYKDAIGNVGIGTSSPGAKLVVDGGTTQDQLRLGNEPHYYKIGRDSVNGPLVFTGTQTGVVGYVFKSNSTEFARIDSSGNLLVGTTTSRGRFTVEASSGNCRAVNVLTGSGTIDAFTFNGGAIGSITTNGVGTSYNTSSDYRLKNTIAPMTGALDKVALLKPVTYKWNADGSDGQGFIAHELAEVEPGCVSGEKDAVDAEGKPQYQGIDTSFLVATLAAAIQEQQAMLVSLKAIVDAQGAEIAALKGASA